MADLIITIDGPAGSGKSTTARLLAKRISAAFLDTGAMYRTVTLAAINAKADMNDRIQLLAILKNNSFDFAVSDDQMTAKINGNDVTEQIRSHLVTENAKYIASAPQLRSELVEMQRKFAKAQKRVVTEGRDQGTVAFPNADFKFYLVADINERAKRRFIELRDKGQKVDLEILKKSIEDRDKSDRDRSVGPLNPPMTPS